MIASLSLGNLSKRKKEKGQKRESFAYWSQLSIPGLIPDQIPPPLPGFQLQSSKRRPENRERGERKKKKQKRDFSFSAKKMTEMTEMTE